MAVTTPETEVQQQQNATVEIRPYQPSDKDAFRSLNEAWISKSFHLEEKDKLTLNDPEKYILAPGGQIIMVFEGDRAVGCCALLALRPGVYEVGKMTISEDYRGRGLGRQMLQHVIEHGRSLGAHSLYLETNTSLHDAIHLYESVGFRHLPPERVKPSPYARANVYMELTF